MNSKELEPQADKALKFLHQQAGEHGIARANADYMEDFLKVEIARLKGMMIGLSDAAATSEALRHPDYLKVLEALRTAREVWYTANFKRGAAEAVLDCWRTACSNERANV